MNPILWKKISAHNSILKDHFKSFHSEELSTVMPTMTSEVNWRWNHNHNRHSVHEWSTLQNSNIIEQWIAVLCFACNDILRMRFFSPELSREFAVNVQQVVMWVSNLQAFELNKKCFILSEQRCYCFVSRFDGILIADGFIAFATFPTTSAMSSSAMWRRGSIELNINEEQKICILHCSLLTFIAFYGNTGKHSTSHQHK